MDLTGMKVAPANNPPPPPQQQQQQSPPPPRNSPELREWLRQGLAHHNAGRPSEAERLYRQILAAEPRHPDALHLMGLLAFQMGKLDIARDLMGRSIQIAPSVPGFLSNYAEVM